MKITREEFQRICEESPLEMFHQEIKAKETLQEIKAKETLQEITANLQIQTNLK